MTATSRNTETSQYLPHTIYHKNAAQKARRNPGDPHNHILQPKTSNIYANAAQQARRNEKSRRPTQQARGLATSQHICTSNFNNIFNPHLHVSSTYLGLNIYSPVHNRQPQHTRKQWSLKAPEWRSLKTLGATSKHLPTAKSQNTTIV